MALQTQTLKMNHSATPFPLQSSLILLFKQEKLGSIYQQTGEVRLIFPNIYAMEIYIALRLSKG